MWWRRCVWLSLVSFLWLTHREWLQDILPSSPSTPSIPPPPDSHIPHRDLILFCTDTVKDTAREGGNQVSKSRGRLPLSLSLLAIHPSHPPISRQRQGTPLISPHLSFTASWPALLWHWMCDRPFSQRLRKCLILPRSRLVKDTHSYSSAGSQFPHCRFLFWH